MTNTNRRKAESPVVDGKTYTFAQLAVLTDTSRSAVSQKYHRVREALGADATITMDHLTKPFVSPTVQAARGEALLRRETDKIVAFARIHGAAHAAMEFKMPRETITTMLTQANAVCHARITPQPAWMRQADK